MTRPGPRRSRRQPIEFVPVIVIGRAERMIIWVIGGCFVLAVLGVLLVVAVALLM